MFVGGGSHLSIAALVGGLGVWEGPGAHFRVGRLCDQRERGASRVEWFLSGEHPPHCGGESAGGVYSGDFGSSLWAESFDDCLVPVPVGVVAGCPDGGFDERPSEPAGSVFG